MNVKQRLLGNAMGRSAQSFRDRLEILRTAWTHPERVGTIANDQLATKLVTALCLPGKTFIDVGAHIGSIIADVAHRDASIKIVAVEAIPEKMVTLRRKFPSVEFHECAVGESNGEVSFFVNNDQSGYSSLGHQAGASEASITEIRVPLRRLDEIVTANDVDAIKIDVEGAELGVLRGSAKLLASCRPMIMFESGPQKDDGLGFTKEALYDYLDSNEYAVLVPNRVAHNDPGLNSAGFVESHLYPRRTTNYFAVPKERRAEIQERANDLA